MIAYLSVTYFPPPPSNSSPFISYDSAKPSQANQQEHTLSSPTKQLSSTPCNALLIFRMVSFVCDTCQETVKKPKLDQHFNRCHYAQFSCIDCSVSFQGVEYRSHTSCISEAEKYQKALYRGPKKVQRFAVDCWHISTFFQNYSSLLLLIALGAITSVYR
ncbi:MAG: hypothetical protein JOS17DRAFT_767184 [Linnemannia elongata]|nr:MAG: hypothetical protein JOS17DRAFT_767184 [Linnemannia elongata]